MKKFLVFLLIILSCFLIGCKKYSNKIQNTSYDVSIDIDNINKALVPAATKGIESNVGVTVYSGTGFASYMAYGTGSGVVYKGTCYLKDGTSLEITQSKGHDDIDYYEYYCITNEHVVKTEGKTPKVKVYIPDIELHVDGSLCAVDKYSDIAVVKFRSYAYITPATLGDSDSLEVGEIVLSIGNPGGYVYGNSVNFGIVGALNRIVDVDRDLNNDGTNDFNGSCYFIQHDASINSGSSGGALVNCKGEVVGINVMKLYNSSDTIEGMCFSIPINLVKDNLSKLESGKDIKVRSLFGTFYSLNEIKNRDVFDVPSRVSLSSDYTYDYGLVCDTIRDSKYGVIKGDIIMSVNNININTTSELNCMLHYNDTFIFKVFRDGSIIEFSYSD